MSVNEATMSACTCSHFSQPSAKKSMPPKLATSAAYSNSPPPTSVGSPIKKYAVDVVPTLLDFHLSRPAPMAGPHSPQTGNGPTPPGLLCTQFSAQPPPPAFTKSKPPYPPACRPPSDRLGPVPSPSNFSSLTDGPSHSSYFSTRQTPLPSFCRALM